MFKNILFLIFVPVCAFALDVTPIDETEEAQKKARENEMAEDGKIIYKAKLVNVINPTNVAVINPTNSAVITPSRKILIAPSEPDIVYEMGKKPPKTIKPQDETSEDTPKEQKSIFTDLNKDSDISVEDIHTQQGDLKLKEESKKSQPINLEDNASD